MKTGPMQAGPMQFNMGRKVNLNLNYNFVSNYNYNNMELHSKGYTRAVLR